MFRNCYYDKKKETIHLWETNEAGREYKSFHWIPYIYIPDKLGNIKTIDGISVKKQEFESYKQYELANNNKSYIKYEDRVKPEIQFLSEIYHNISDESIVNDELNICGFDIELKKENGAEPGFPTPQKNNAYVISIAVKSTLYGRKIFGLKEYSGKWKDNFILCSDEKDLLIKFFNYINKLDIDVLTGWNIYNFDLPYLYYRCKKLFGNYYNFKKLSPINIVNVWDKREGGINIDIAGVSILDYMEIYKKYTANNVESYKLDFISKLELNDKKIEYDGLLDDLYEKDWELAIDYNMHDVDLIFDLEEKLKYIYLIQTISLISKCPMKFHDKVTNVLEGIFLTYYRRNGLCAPKIKGGTSHRFEAAYVKDPQRGLHKWVGDMDVTSMYPYIMIMLNMSLETYYGCILNLSEQEIIFNIRRGYFDEFILEKNEQMIKISENSLKQFNKDLKNKKYSIAPNGAVFSNEKDGVVKIIEKTFFKIRKNTKAQMLELKKNNGDKNLIQQLNTTQLAIKVGVLNSLYGSLSTPYFRLYNLKIAEAITSCGRYILKTCMNEINNFLNNKTDTDSQVIDFITYMDTDSMFVCLNKLYENNEKYKKYFNNLDFNKKIDFSLKVFKQIEEYINNFSYKQIQQIDFNSNETDFKLNWKQEIIAPSILHVEKKKYGYWCVNEEGIPCDKIKITGLDIIKSETSKEIKSRLKTIMEMLLKGNDIEEIKNKINDFKGELKNCSIEDLSVNIRTNNIEKFITKSGCVKGTPWHIKGVYFYRQLLKRYNIENNYEDCIDGDKNRVIYLKNNKYNYTSITYPTKFPKEFLKDIQPDIDLMIDKYFIKKIELLTNPCNLTKELISNNDSFDIFF